MSWLVLSVLPRLICLADVTVILSRSTCSGCPVLVILFKMPYPNCPATVVSSPLPCPSCPVLAVMFWPSFSWMYLPASLLAVLFWLSCPSVLSQLSCFIILSPAHLSPPHLSRQSNPCCNISASHPLCLVLADLSRLNCPGWPVQPDLFKLTYLSWPIQYQSQCHVPVVMSQLCYHGFSAMVVPSQLSCPSCAVLFVLPCLICFFALHTLS